MESCTRQAGRTIGCAYVCGSHGLSTTRQETAGHFRSRESDIRAEGHRAAADAGGVEKSVADGGCNGHDRRFTGPCGGNVLAIEKNGFDLRQVAETRDTVGGKAR